MAIVSIKPNLKIDAYQGQYESLYFLPKLKKCENQFDKRKKATRILRNLTNDAVSRNSDIPAPSTWILRALVSSHLCGDIETDWQESIYMTLAFIAQCASNTSELKFTFLQPDKSTPLFPNSEGFCIEDMYSFAVSLIEYLNEQHTNIYR